MLGAAGGLDPLFEIDVSLPPVLDPSAEGSNRPYVVANVNSSGRIDTYTIEDSGGGYGVVPGYKVELSGRPEEAGTLSAVRDEQGANVRVIPEKPRLVFDVAKNVDSFIDPASVTAGYVANLEIVFKNETQTEQRNLEGDLDGDVWDNPLLEQEIENKGVDEEAIFKNTIDRELILKREEDSVLRIPVGNLSDNLEFFDGELFSINDLDLNRLEAELSESYGDIADIRDNFGEDYSLWVNKKQVLSYVNAGRLLRRI